MKERMTAEKLAKYFDHTLLKAYASDADFKVFCEESAKYGVKMVAINSVPVQKCKKYLEGSDVLVGAAIGFPLGQTTVENKLHETAEAIENGADEIDYVINIGELKSGNLAYVEDEMRRIVALCRAHGKTVKVIFENCYLTREEKVSLCEIARRVKPDFVKTSTGFGTPSGGAAVGATVEDVRLMKSLVGDEVKVKAAGGVRTLADALAMIEAGAERIGTSASVRIIEEFNATAGEK